MGNAVRERPAEPITVAHTGIRAGLHAVARRLRWHWREPAPSVEEP